MSQPNPLDGKTCEVCGRAATAGAADFDEAEPVEVKPGVFESRWKTREVHYFCFAHARRGLRHCRGGKVIDHTGKEVQPA